MGGRADVRADLDAGEVGGFDVNQALLLGTIVYAITIIAGAIGEWGYYILGSGIEVALLAAIVYYAWTWPRYPATLERNPA